VTAGEASDPPASRPAPANSEASGLEKAAFEPSVLEAGHPSVRPWLRAEGVVAFVGGIVAWSWLGGNPAVLIALILTPDLAMLGYLRGPAIGAFTYNVAHSWATAGVLIGLGLALAVHGFVLAGVLLVTHAGMDRGLGYGLKYPTAFHDTHLGRIGRRA